MTPTAVQVTKILAEARSKKLDGYRALAAEIYKVDYDDVTPLQRGAAKFYAYRLAYSIEPGKPNTSRGSR